MAPSEPSTSQTSPYALVMAALIFAILIAIFYVLFVTYSQNGYYLAMFYSGIMALILSVALYLGGALTRNRMPGLAATGSFWFGIVMLFGADLSPQVPWGSPNTGYNVVARVPLLVVTLILVIVGVGGMWWQSTAKVTEDRRQEERAAWRRSTGVVAPGEGKTPPTGGQN